MSPSPAPDPHAGSPTLTNRLMERLRQAGLAEDVPSGRSASGPRRRRSDAHRLQADIGRTPEELQEARSLRRVFREMGDSYREYRRRTGAPISARVRSAAVRFRRDRNVTSLAAVAASLDELQVLTW